MMEFLLNYPDISPRVINKQDRRGHTPLDLALEQETAIQNILVELLQDNGGKTKDDIQSTIFHAAELEDIEAVKSIKLHLDLGLTWTSPRPNQNLDLDFGSGPGHAMKTSI